MSWMEQGHTWRRILQADQTVQVSAGQFSVPANFNNIRTPGLLKKIYLRSPYQQATTAVTPGSGTIVLPAPIQQPQGRILQHVKLQMQGVSPIYDVDGPDLLYLAYVGSGLTRHERALRRSQKMGYSSNAALLSSASSGVPANQDLWAAPATIARTGGGGIWYHAPVVEYPGSGNQLNIGYYIELPITEWITLPSGASSTGQVNGDAEIEVGFIYMQTAQQNIAPYVQVGSLYGADLRSVMQVTGNSVAALANMAWILGEEYYDLPSDPSDMPAAEQLAMVVTRTAVDENVSGGNYTHWFQRAGLLLRAIYVFYNDSSTYGTLVDATVPATAGTTGGTITLTSGGSVNLITESVTDNAQAAWQEYGTPPPGILVHDLVANGWTTNALDTGQLLDLRTIFTGLPTSITRCHVIEERLVSLEVA